MTTWNDKHAVSCVHIVCLHFAFGRRQPWEITRIVCLSPQVRLVAGSGLLLQEHGHTTWEWLGSLFRKCGWFTALHCPKNLRKEANSNSNRMVLCSKLGHQLGADVWMLGTLNSNLTPFGKTLIIDTTLLWCWNHEIQLVLNSTISPCSLHYCRLISFSIPLFASKTPTISPSITPITHDQTW